MLEGLVLRRYENIFPGAYIWAEHSDELRVPAVQGAVNRNCRVAIQCHDEKA